jgi:hypothetical protein
MDIKKTIATINQMRDEGVIGQYAVGGAVGATFYLEPADTKDVDVFIVLKPKEGQSIVDYTPIYDWLSAKNFHFIEIDGKKTEYIEIAGWPVQFLPADKPLYKEAFEQSVEQDMEDIPVRVFSAEHLAAIALEVGRAKDKARLLHFQEAGVLDKSRFHSILERNRLLERWEEFKKQFNI